LRGPAGARAPPRAAGGEAQTGRRLHRGRRAARPGDPAPRPRWPLPAAAAPRLRALRVSDQDLVERAAAGDLDAFTALVESRRDRVYRIARHLVGDDELARDVAQ